MEQMSFLMKNFRSLTKNKTPKKRRITYKSSSSESETESAHFLKNGIGNNRQEIDFYSPTEHSHSIAMLSGRCSKKRQELKHMAAAVIVEMKDADDMSVPIRALLNTGTTSTIALNKFINKHMEKYETKATTWSTLGGKFKTRRKARINLKMPKFSETKSIMWLAHAGEFTNPKLAQYDMIIGTDIMEKCGIDILFSQDKIIWDNNELPMSNRDLVSNHKATEMLFQAAKQSPIIQKAEQQHKKILDADYSAVDIDDYVAKLSEVTNDAKIRLKLILQSCKLAFKGGLRTLKINPIEVELKPGSKPYHAKPFPISKVYYETTRKECEQTQSGPPVLHTTKEEG